MKLKFQKMLILAFQKTLILALQKTLILAFEANSALSHENETKIVKITHSVLYSPVALKTSWGWNRAVVQKKKNGSAPF